MPDNLHAVGTIFTNSKGQILLLLRKKEVREGDKWGLVGGQIKNRESKVDAALRKIKEEIGLDIKPSDLKFIKTYNYLWKSGNKNILFETFKADWVEKFELNLNTKGAVDYVWISPEKAYKKDNLMVGLYEILSDLYNTDN